MVFAQTNYCNFARPKKILCFDGDFVLLGFVVSGFHSTLKIPNPGVRIHVCPQTKE